MDKRKGIIEIFEEKMRGKKIAGTDKTPSKRLRTLFIINNSRSQSIFFYHTETIKSKKRYR